MEKCAEIDHVLTGKRWHSGVTDVQSFRGADCNTAKVKETLSVSFIWRDLIAKEAK
jgi:hypothetical protein